MSVADTVLKPAQSPTRQVPRAAGTTRVWGLAKPVAALRVV